MSEPLAILFISKNGIRGTLRTYSRLLDEEPERSVIFETGRKATIGKEHFHLRPDGSYYLDLNVDPRPPDSVAAQRVDQGPDASSATSVQSGNVVIPRVEEQLVIEKRVRETGRVRVTKHVVETPEHYDAMVRSEDYAVERVPVDREVSEMQGVRVEGDVTIIPIYREELVMTKRLVLIEEIHLTKRVREDHNPGTTVLRKQEVVVERITAGPSGSTASDSRAPSPRSDRTASGLS